MECPQCHASVPEVARYCQQCGRDLHGTDQARDASFAVKPDEPVASFAVVSTLMPRGAGQRGQTYRVILLIALAAALLAACFGAVPLAVLLAAFAIPVVYIVYLYDVNVWDDHPVQVTVMAFLLTLVLGVTFTLLWFNVIGVARPAGGPSSGGALSAFSAGGLLVTALLVPVVGEVLRQVGPVFLASRPRYDDLLDGASFGVVSGVAFATADTLVRHWPLIAGGFTREIDPGLWMSLIFLEGFVKPLIIGTASGIACAEFSGLGRGYDGFSGRYLRGLGEAVLANVAYFGGVHLLSYLNDPTLTVVLSIVLGLAILGVLLIRMRRVLHVALLEAALEAAQTEDAGRVVPQDEQQFCPQCEMPLLVGASFCNNCGASARAREKVGAVQAAAPVAASAAQSPPPPTTEPLDTDPPAGEAGEAEAAPQEPAGVEPAAAEQEPESAPAENEGEQQ